MLFITHAVTGAALGGVSGNLVLAFILGWISHHILDVLPHNDPGSWFVGKPKQDNLTKEQLIMAVADVLIGLVILYLLRSTVTFTSAIYWGALGGVLPDLMDNTPFIKTIFRSNKFGRLYHGYHEKYHTTLPWRRFVLGIGLQVVIVAIGLAFLYYRPI